MLPFSAAIAAHCPAVYLRRAPVPPPMTCGTFSPCAAADPAAFFASCVPSLVHVSADGASRCGDGQVGAAACAFLRSGHPPPVTRPHPFRDVVEELEAEASHQKEAPQKDALEVYCEDAPESDECRKYEN